MEFPLVNISRGTLYKIQRKCLRYSFKKIIRYVPKLSACHALKRVYFIKHFLNAICDKNRKVFVLDEVGFGTKPLKHYSYSKIGFPAIIKNYKKLSKNLTCTACISEDCVEFIRFFSEGGTKKEYFADYMDTLIECMKKKYPDK